MKKKLIWGKGLLLVGVILGISVFSAPSQASQPNIFRHKPISVSGEERYYSLVIPSSYNPNQSIPLMLAFPASDTDDLWMLDNYELQDLAEANNYILAILDPPNNAPADRAINQAGKHWQITSNSPDITFSQTIINKLTTEYSIDRQRIYSYGFAHGGFFAYFLAMEMPEVIAAFGEHSAGMNSLSAVNECPVSEYTFTFGDCGELLRTCPATKPDWPASVNRSGRKVPGFITHGNFDENISIYNSCNLLKGMQNQSYQAESMVLEGIGHDYDVSVNQPLWDFLSAHKIEVAPGAPNPPSINEILSPTRLSSQQISGGKDPGTSIWLNGTQLVPMNNSSSWSANVRLFEGENMLRLRARKVTGEESLTTSALIVYDKVPPITTVSPDGGNYRRPQEVSLTTDEEATVYYTLDGSYPNERSTQYHQPIPINNEATITFFAEDLAGNREKVRTKKYYIGSGEGITPTTKAFPVGGNYDHPVTVTLEADVEATIYYTVDGSDPRTNGIVYSGPITLNESTTLKFRGYEASGLGEEARTEVYTLYGSNYRHRLNAMATAAGEGGGPHIRGFYPNMIPGPTNFMAFEDSFRGGARIGLADIDLDGVGELLIGSGPGRTGEVKINKIQGPQLFDWIPFHVDFRGGVDVAGGDINGDRRDEVAVCQYSSGQAWVKLYDFSSGTPVVINTWNAFGDPEVGCTVSMGDVDGDGLDEVVVGAGKTGGPQVMKFEADGRLIDSFFAFDPHLRTGVDVAAGKIRNANIDDVVVSRLYGSEAWIKSIESNYERTLLAEWLAFPSGVNCGANIDLVDVNFDNLLDVMAGAGRGGGPQILTFSGFGDSLGINYFAYDPQFRGGVSAAGGHF